MGKCYKKTYLFVRSLSDYPLQAISRDKHSSLLGQFINKGCKKFNKIDTLLRLWTLTYLARFDKDFDNCGRSRIQAGVAD